MGRLTLFDAQIAQWTSERWFVGQDGINFIRTPEAGVGFQILDLLKSSLMLRIGDQSRSGWHVDPDGWSAGSQFIRCADGVLSGVFRIDAQDIQSGETEIVNASESVTARERLTVVEPLNLKFIQI